MLGHNGIHGCRFKKFTSIHDRLAREINKFLQRVDVPYRMTIGRTTLIQKDPSKETAPNYYRPMPTDDVENINSTNKGIYFLLANRLWIVLRGTERMSQRIEKHSSITFHRSTHSKLEQDQTEKSSYGLAWLQKGIWHGSAKLDNKLLQNVQNIRCSHKPYRENHKNLESGIDSRRKVLSWSKNRKR